MLCTCASWVHNKFWPLWWRHSVSIRVQTTLNHIRRPYFLPQYQLRNKMFFKRASWKRYCVRHRREHLLLQTPWRSLHVQTKPVWQNKKVNKIYSCCVPLTSLCLKNSKTSSQVFDLSQWTKIISLKIEHLLFHFMYCFGTNFPRHAWLAQNESKF